MRQLLFFALKRTAVVRAYKKKDWDERLCLGLGLLSVSLSVSRRDRVIGSSLQPVVG